MSTPKPNNFCIFDLTTNKNKIDYEPIIETTF